MDQSEYDQIQNELIQSVLRSSYEVELDKESETQEIDPLLQEQYLIDEEDKDILMHRDAHFGGSFSTMLEYYADSKKGAVLDVSLKRINYLKESEEKLNKNLAPLLLNGPDAEKVHQAKKMYSDLRAVLEKSKDKNSISAQIAALILSESEDFEEDARTISALGEKVIPYLIEIIESSYLSDPLFPGYGFAPVIAAFALGQLKAEKAIEPLFLLMKQNPDEYELFVLPTLAAIGEKAKDFLVRIVKSRPINPTNAQAAYALLQFQENDTSGEIATLCLEQLQDKAAQKDKSFPLYLIAGCESLPSHLRKEFENLAKSAELSSDAKDELNFILKQWKQHS
jgi:hypothetical protein